MYGIGYPQKLRLPSTPERDVHRVTHCKEEAPDTGELQIPGGEEISKYLFF